MSAPPSEPSTAFVLRPARREDVPAIVTVHLQAFPGFFLSFLGPRFLHELYRGILADGSGILLVCIRGSRVAGFVAGTCEPAGFYRRLARQRSLHFAMAALLPLLRRPAILPRLLRAFRKPAEENQANEEAALLMSLAVDPSIQRSGIGQQLVNAFVAACVGRNVPRVRLTTDRADNEPVNRFYERCGFRLLRTFSTPEGRSMNEYLFATPSDRPVS